MVAPYDNAADASQQLRNSVVLYKGVPYTCEDVIDGTDGALWVRLYNSADGRRATVKLFDPDFDAKSLSSRLGYCNFRNHIGTVFMTRVPSRQWRQGLHGSTLTIKSTNSKSVSFGTVTESQGFGEMLRGEYPSLSEAIKFLESHPEVPEMAFRVDMAVKRSTLDFYVLSYRTEEVAWGEAAEVMKFGKNYPYLKGLLSA